jgi:B12 binding domain
MNVLFIFPNIDIAGYKPIGISSLIAVAKKLKHKVKLFDTSFYNVKELSSNVVFLNSKQAGEEVLNFIPVDLSKYNIDKKNGDLNSSFVNLINDFKPDVVALSIFSQEYALGMSLLKMAKDLKNDFLTVVGGIHCYTDPEEVINNEFVNKPPE